MPDLAENISGVSLNGGESSPQLALPVAAAAALPAGPGAIVAGRGLLDGAKSTYASITSSAGARINAVTGGGSGTFWATWLIPAALAALVLFLFTGGKSKGSRKPGASFLNKLRPKSGGAKLVKSYGGK